MTEQDEKLLKTVEDNSQIEEKAKEIASKEVDTLKSGLLEALGGNQSKNEWGWEGKDSQGRPAPKDWEEAPNKIVNKAVTEAEKRFEEKLKKKELSEAEKVKSQEEAEKKSKQEEMNQTFKRMSTEWQEAVADGILPEIGDDVKKELKAGKKFEELSDEQREDAGLKAWNEVKELHLQKMKAGESSSLYRTAQKFYRKKPAGAKAPVAGDSKASVTTEEDVEPLEETRKRRFLMFGR